MAWVVCPLCGKELITKRGNIESACEHFLGFNENQNPVWDVIKDRNGNIFRDRVELLLSRGLWLYSHEPEEYAYFGWPGENEGTLSYRVSYEYVEAHNIPISGLYNKWYKLPNGEEYPGGL